VKVWHQQPRRDKASEYADLGGVFFWKGRGGGGGTSGVDRAPFWKSSEDSHEEQDFVELKEGGLYSTA